LLANKNLLFYFLKLKSKIFSFLPRNITIGLGRMLGYFMYYIVPLRKKVALANLKIAFPEKSISEIRLLLKKCYIHFGILASDFLRLPRLNKYNIDEIIKIDKKTKNILNKNCPAIIMTGHIGNWELLLPALGYNNYYSSGVARTQKNKSGEKFFNWIRNCDNSNLIPKKKSIHAMNKALDNNHYLILASDQSAGQKGTLNKFFNNHTSTPKGAAIFHLKKNVPIIIIFVIRRKTNTYKLVTNILDIKFKEETDDEKIKIINDFYNLELEKIIKKYPNQYFWFHRKWTKKHYQ
tara:strand:+ start:112 stop:990 length:879 start_codon:yes stop_codon:yes gene_type:complete